jgi:uncharacterized protein (TIGR04255 family)
MFALQERLSSARQYREPPVHEVIFSLNFERPIADEELESIGHLLEGRFSRSDRQQLTNYGLTIGPSGSQILPAAPQFAGWIFQDEAPTRVFNAGRQQVSLHSIRPGEWPSGTYAGWTAMQVAARELMKVLQPIYEKYVIRRSGLRYLNRIAVPANSELEDWFTIGFAAPGFLLDPFAINLRQTWSRCEGQEDLSVTVGLAMIEIPERVELHVDHVGFLLDIEIFNLWPDKAPSYDQLAEWCSRAHDVENAVFESSIREPLRQRFGVLKK